MSASCNPDHKRPPPHKPVVILSAAKDLSRQHDHAVSAVSFHTFSTATKP